MNELLQKTRDQLLSSVNPPQLTQAVETVVEAGKKVMYSEQTRDLLLEQLQADGDVPEIVGSGVAKLAVLLYSEYKNTLPMEVLMPASFLLMLESLDFLERAGEAEITNDLLAECTQETGASVLQAFGITPEKIAEAQAAQGGGAQSAGQALPAAGGLIGGAMGGMQ